MKPNLLRQSGHRLEKLYLTRASEFLIFYSLRLLRERERERETKTEIERERERERSFLKSYIFA